MKKMFIIQALAVFASCSSLKAQQDNSQKGRIVSINRSYSADIPSSLKSRIDSVVLSLDAQLSSIPSL